MSRAFTTSQKKAHDIQRHLSVTANAGSGKTTVLVHRYVNILLQTDAEVSDVVAITFTDKTASELCRKIAQAIDRSISTTTKQSVRLKLTRARERLSSAPIGTIHSFCARILRDHPIEAGVDAAFTVMEQVDQRAMMREAIAETFQDAFRSGDASRRRRDDALSLLRAFGKSKVLRTLEAMLEKREPVEHLRSSAGLYSKSDDEVLAAWSTWLESSFHGLARNENVRRAVRTLSGVVEVETAEAVGHHVNTYSPRMKWTETAQWLNKLCLAFLTKKGEFRKAAFTEIPTASNILRDTAVLRDLYSVAENFEHFAEEEVDALHRNLIELTRIMFAMYDRVSQRFADKKSEQGVLDFDDLLLSADRLLDLEDVRTSLAQRYRYLMVDEYQDTNRLQYSILRKLILNYTAGNLFIVGDPKQSIYGFRDADVEVFGETKADILRSSLKEMPFRWSDENLTSDARELRGDVVLPESFRLLRDLVAFTNILFSHLMAADGEPFEVGYDLLVQARANSTPGDVELLLTPERDEEADVSAGGGECEHIADRIVDLLNAQAAVFDPPEADEQPRPMRYSDIAVILRNRNNLAALERALVLHGLPYRVSGGIGFYQTQEVYDVLNYLQFLLNPRDDVALMGILRSPFFAVSDAELFEISLVSPAGRGGLLPSTFFERLECYARAERAGKRILRAARLLSDHLARAGSMTPFALLKKIVSDTAWFGASVSMERGSQQCANIEKLLRFAREYEQRGLVGLYDFVERLRALVNDHDEAQAPSEDHDNAIHIMTIHGAKGLEFPVVILPFLHEPFRHDNEPYLDRRYGLGISTKDEESTSESVSAPIAVFLRNLQRQKKEAEEKRILYVACTRARDRLILSGNPHMLKKQSSYLRWIFDALGVDGVPVHKAVELDVTTAIRTGQGEATECAHRLRIPVVQITLPQKLEVRTKEEMLQRGEVSVAIELLSAKSHGEVISASQLLTLSQCPTKFYLTYRLGAHSLLADQAPPPQVLGEIAADEREEEGAVQPNLRGTIVHAVLERIVPPSGTHTEDVAVALDEVLVRDGISHEVAEALRAEVLPLIDSLVRSTVGRQIFAAKSAKVEQSITAVYGCHFLTGTVDRLMQHEDGSWHIIDYKTDNVSFESLPQAAERYRPQMDLYAYLLSRMYPSQDSVTATLVFLRHPEHPVTFQYSQEKLRAYERTLEQMVAQIERIDERGSAELPKRTSHCPECEFFRRSHCVLFPPTPS